MAVVAERRSLWWLWTMAVPVVPVVLGVIILEWVGAPPFDGTMDPSALAPPALAALHQGSNRLLFAAAAAIHTAMCISALVYFAFQLIRIGEGMRRAILVMALVVAGGVLLAMAALWTADPPLAAYQYSYFEIAALLGHFPAARDLIDPAAPVPALALCVFYPSALGIVTVVLASGVVCAAGRRIARIAEKQDSGPLLAHIRILLRCFYVLSGILVSSTVAALLFFRLPTGFASPTPAGKALETAISDYTGGVGTFWAAIYTLTLFAVFAGPATFLYAHVKRIVAEDGKGLTIAAWLSEQGIPMTLGTSIKNVFVLIAPLLVGPIGDLIKLFGT